jgi:hypothetical protein
VTAVAEADERCRKFGSLGTLKRAVWQRSLAQTDEKSEAGFAAMLLCPAPPGLNIS